MKQRPRFAAGLSMSICLCLGSPAYPQTQSPAPDAAIKETVMTMNARGTFDVKVTPLPQDERPQAATLGRMALDKQFHGDLEATSTGQMLTAGSVATGSAGYVAMEFVSGTLNGRDGTFVLQHSGTMSRGALQLSVTVVPDSGTGKLAGLSGRMAIIIAEGKHSYEFEYTLAEPRP